MYRFGVKMVDKIGVYMSRDPSIAKGIRKMRGFNCQELTGCISDSMVAQVSRAAGDGLIDLRWIGQASGVKNSDIDLAFTQGVDLIGKIIEGLFGILHAAVYC